MVVDAVCDVYNVGLGDCKPPPDVCGGVETIFVKALTTVDQKMLILLDIDRLIGHSLADATLPSGAAAA